MGGRATPHGRQWRASNARYVSRPLIFYVDGARNETGKNQPQILMNFYQLSFLDGAFARFLFTRHVWSGQGSAYLTLPFRLSHLRYRLELQNIIPRTTQTTYKHNGAWSGRHNIYVLNSLCCCLTDYLSH